MTKPILTALGIYFAALAAFLILAPLTFYNSIPGASSTGPFNSHFTRDVGLAFLVSAAGLVLGAWRGDRPLALMGAAFPVLHGIFHVSAWGHHTFPSKSAAIGDLAATAGIAAFAIIVASRVKGGGA